LFFYFRRRKVFPAPASGADESPLEKGMEALQKRDLLVAELAFTQATAEQPLNAHAWKLLGSVYIAQEQFPKAELPLSRACAIDAHERKRLCLSARAWSTLVWAMIHGSSCSRSSGCQGPNKRHGKLGR